MSLFISAQLAYVGPLAFKVDKFFGTKLTFERLKPITVNADIARRMETDCPTVYMMTQDADGLPALKYLAFLVDNDLKEQAEKLVKQSAYEESLDELLASVNFVSASIPANELNPVETPDSVKQALLDKLEGKVVTFKRELEKLPSKLAVIQKAKSVMSDLSVTEGDGTKKEIVAAIVAEYKKELGV
ncbi:hypothetical protein [Pseudoalteromonas rubra]|uniref:hypothetical protein n=1 Tax=Pseudoalteromonas rubra TaxID=43658 RepID=UPI002DBBFCD3|nr:hypothetical protein [Pseudoalteromonas rubra]MEC4091586.1 hypothetical protein [Pseudoalteromonas rubra]